MRYRSFLCTAITLAVPASGQSTSLRGREVDHHGVSVLGAEVKTIRESSRVARTAADGGGRSFFLAVPPSHSVQVRADSSNDLQTSLVPFSSGRTSHFTLLRPGETAAASTSGSVQDVVENRKWVLGGLIQGGVGLSDRSDYNFLTAAGHAGKLLMHAKGPGPLQGTFEYAVEAFPYWQVHTPNFQKISCTSDPGSTAINVCSKPYYVGGTFTGVSVTPIILRWNFTHGQRWMPWLQGAGGLIWTSHKFPAVGNTNAADTASNGPHGDTSVWNFTPQFGVGTHYFFRPRRSFDFSANAVHISSASLGDKNPGVNTSVQFSVGYSWWK